MSRPIVLSNGELHVGLNNYGLVHDLYFPYVGLENHAADNSLRHHIGVWVDGELSWLDDSTWTTEFSYPHNALIGHTVAKNEKFGITIEFDDLVDSEYSALLRNIHIISDHNTKRDIRLFMHQAFIIGDSLSNTDTAQYLPNDHAMLHYRGRRAFIISGQIQSGEWFDQYTCGLFGIEGKDGTWWDAEDGELNPCNVEHGRVDSTFRFSLNIEPHGSVRLNYWIACGTSLREAMFVHKQVQKRGFGDRFTATAHSWHNWLAPARKLAAKLPESLQDHFVESLMILKSHIDKRGAVIASTDTAMLNSWRDVYGYAWPRDGAHAVWPLIRMGYYDEPYRFFEFSRRGLNAGGYLSHKYRADGALGSSWHPYLHDNGDITPPIQTDETALVLFVFTQFYHTTEDKKLLHDFYEPMVKPMSDFLSQHVDLKTGLPKPSYDLWEENYMVTLYTTSVTVAALYAAAGLAEVKDDTACAVQWRNAAETMANKAREVFYNHDRGVFYKGFRTNKAGDMVFDDTIDMSGVYGAFMFGLYQADSHEIVSSISKAKEVFGFSIESPGMPRYENDRYLRRNEEQPNWWPIVSLWLAQHSLEMSDTEQAKSIINWVNTKMRTTSALPEQVCPCDGMSVSVEPLAWSQAEYLSTLLDIITEK